MLDEKALRLPTWKQGNDVVLADGQVWSVPKPRLKFRPKFIDGQAVVRVESFGPDLDPLIEIMMGIVDVDLMIWLAVRFDIISRLLRMNYDLSDDALSDLLVIDTEDSANSEMWDELTKVARGESPNARTESISEPAL